jgi:hypothetical protein
MAMSALLPKADMCSATRHVRFVPIADIVEASARCPLCPYKQTLPGLVGLSGKGTFQETVLYNPSTMNARDFVDLILMAIISFEF